MKKSIISLVSMAAIFVGCQTELMNESETTEKSASFEASTEVFESQTKTSITPEKYVVWSSGDHIAIFQGSTLANEYAVTEASVGTSNGTFTRVMSSGDDFYAGTELPCNVALYPYADNLSLTGTMENDGTAYKVTGFALPGTQEYTAGSFANGAFPMVAVTAVREDHNLLFKNVLGAMRLQLKGTQTVTSIKINGKNNEKLSGAAVITAYANGLTPAITMTGADDASKSVTLDCGNGVQLSESTATDFIIALPPVLFSKGFTVTVTDSEAQIYTIETNTANTVLRSSILVMPTVTLDASGEGMLDDDNTESGVKVLEIAFDKTSLTLAPNTSYSITTIVVPSTADDKILTWSSNAPTIATVDQDGVVTAVYDGEATITAVAVGGVSKSCTVTVISLPAQATATADYIDEYKINHGKGIAIGGTVWAPVNCGYKAPTVVDGVTTDKGYPYGKLYQWGRKYGQGYSADYDSEPNTYPAPVSAIIGQDVSMATYFFTGSLDWVDTRNDAIWNSGTESDPVKTDYDPCPIGWRVPTYNELKALSSVYSDMTINDAEQYGMFLSGITAVEYDVVPPVGENRSQVFLSAAGYRFFDGGVDDRGDFSGYYWSSKGFSNNRAYYLEVRDYAYVYDKVRASGCSVRCVQVTD